MNALNITAARKQLYRLVEEIQNAHEPLIITGKKGSAVLIAEDDWRSIEETLYLLSIPGMRESIRAGIDEAIEDCSKEIRW